MQNEDDFIPLEEEHIPDLNYQSYNQSARLKKEYMSYLKDLRIYLDDNEITLKKLPSFDKYLKLAKEDKLFDFPD